MAQLFGKNYQEAGSSSSPLLLRSNGEIKLQWGNKFIDLIEVMGNKKEMIFRNLFSGLWKGIGIGIGVTLVTAIIIVILQKIIKLNIPVISEYITDIVEIVEKTKSIR